MFLSKETIWKLLNFFRFGLIATGIDFLVYSQMLIILSTASAKAVGFVCGMLISFAANRKMTFKHKGRISISLLKFAIIYSFSLLANIFVNESIHANSKIDNLATIVVGFALATAVSVTINFLSMYFWIFSDKKSVES